ncbi:hypothetical protein [Vibrio penaeicida]|nr:hypothetical protein [Vibrio penaeicida]
MLGIASHFYKINEKLAGMTVHLLFVKAKGTLLGVVDQISLRLNDAMYD